MIPSLPSNESNLVDTVRLIETPEGIELELRVAGPVSRAFAWLVDMGIRLMAYTLFANLLVLFGRMGIGILLVGVFLLEWLYPVLFEVLWNGQTPGKRALGLRVLKEDGTPVDWGSSIQRSLIMFADFLPLLYGAGLGAMMLSRDFQRLGDIVAGTLVVHVDAATRKVRGPRRAVQSQANSGGPHPSPLPPGPNIRPEAPPVPLSLLEQRALISFQERIASLNPDRAQELADLLEPLTGQKGPSALLRIQAMAAQMRGSAAGGKQRIAGQEGAP